MQGFRDLVGACRNPAAKLVAAYLTLGVMIRPYVNPYTLTVADAAAPDASLGFLNSMVQS
jgi:cytochrome bd-type quinol oxidase subunit 2